MFENVGDAAYIVQLVVAFGAGVISFISPCVLPLLPGYLSMMSGYSAVQLEQGEVSTARMTRVILLFILGFTVVFAALGAGATGFGQFLRSNVTTFTRIAGVLIIAFGVLMVAMAISNRGFLAVMNSEKRVHVRPSRLGKWAPPVMGAAFGFGWTPCIGPILSVLLLTAGTQETVIQGIILLVAYSLGLGVPFLLAGLGLFKFFGKLKPYLRPINIVSGVLLTLFGVVMVTNNLGRLSNWFVEIFDAVPFLRGLQDV
ncbi:MAG TPA: cytochrome c biogenesis CcdA family protein [Acidimicrobiia bacterium]|nr:cytochrome c biogenesis CcdA family protein [Acidimicrobiia bacterium]